MPTITISPFKNVTYYKIPVATNASIMQIDVESSDFFERKGSGTWTHFWTSPKLDYGYWRFVFHNPSSSSVNVTAILTEFYLKITEYKNVEYYRSLLNSLYGYAGVIAIIAGTTLNVIHVSREDKRRN